MDHARLAAELTDARFATTQFRQGYDVREVDRFIDEVVAALRAGAPADELAARVRGVRFGTTSLQRGYDMADVDAALESVVTSLGDTSLPTRPTVEAAPPATTAADSTAAPGPGVLARLLAAVRGDQPLR